MSKRAEVRKSMTTLRGCGEQSGSTSYRGLEFWDEAQCAKARREMVNVKSISMTNCWR